MAHNQGSAIGDWAAVWMNGAPVKETAFAWSKRHVVNDQPLGTADP